MKLYFYILVDGKTMKSVEVEVRETPTGYAAIGEFPNEYAHDHVFKIEIGCVYDLVRIKYVILTEPNLDLAKRLFYELYSSKINELSNQLSAYRDAMRVVKDFQLPPFAE